MFLCDTCINKCKQNKNSCQNYEHMVDEIELNELNYETRRQNVNLHRFARDNNLNYKYLTNMLKGKIPMNYKTLYLLNSRLNEKDWIVEFLEKHPSGFNESNNFACNT